MGTNDDQLLRNAVWEFVTDDPKREKAADQRNRDLIRAHEQGWKLVADAIGKGLGQIADAIRAHGR